MNKKRNTKVTTESTLDEKRAHTRAKADKDLRADIVLL
jgi:hypothetical protein